MNIVTETAKEKAVSSLPEDNFPSVSGVSDVSSGVCRSFFYHSVGS